MIENKCAHLLEQNEYREDALNYMMSMQYDLQKFVANKRGNLAPDADAKPFDFSKEAIYYWGCVTTEYAELMERDFISGSAEDLLETQFEYIDMFHFLMNFFIFTKITSFNDVTLQDLYETTIDPFCEPHDQIEKTWSAISIEVGEYIDSVPFKHWKTYPDDIQIDTKELELRALQIMYHFIVMGKSLNIDKEHFFNLYVSKNKENINRQNNNY